MRIACLIPTRGDRPLFLENCLRMLNNQTVLISHIEIVDDSPVNNTCDITWRYRNGYDRLRNKGFDVIALIEDDDYYAPDYLETIIRAWEAHGKPELFGTSYTIYYNLREKSWLTMHHSTRSSAMSTLIKPDLLFPWTCDNDPYTDIWLWKLLNGVIFVPKKHICIGIKHGIGLCGGQHHTTKLERYTNKDPDQISLKEWTDPESFIFYSQILKYAYIPV